MHASIIVSSFNRAALFRRTLWSIANRPPGIPFELVVVDDGSTEDVLGELRTFSSSFPWKFVEFDREAFEQETGLSKFHNNPCVTNNIGFAHCSEDSDIIFQQGNEVIAWEGCYDQMIADIPPVSNWMVMSTTYDVPAECLNLLDRYGQNFLPAYLEHFCKKFPLQTKFYPSDVTNYICAASRSVWENLRGYDERYYGGISAEDSDFVRRARTLPEFKQVISEGISCHQFHSGMTRYYTPPQKVISKDKWNEGVQKNHSIFRAWDGTFINPTSWETGSIGVKSVITNMKANA